MVQCTPDWGTTGEHAYWRRLLDRITVGRPELPNGPIYIPEDSRETMPAADWRSFLSILDGSLNSVPVSDLDQVVLKELMALPSWISRNVRVLFGHYYEQGTPAVSTPLADADDRLSNIASGIFPVDREMVTLKHSAFPAQLLMDEMELGEPPHGGSHDHAVFSCRPQMALQVRYLVLNPLPTICPSPGTMYTILNRFFGLRLRVPSDGCAWTSSRGPGKSLYDLSRMMKT